MVAAEATDASTARESTLIRARPDALAAIEPRLAAICPGIL